MSILTLARIREARWNRPSDAAHMRQENCFSVAGGHESEGEGGTMTQDQEKTASTSASGDRHRSDADSAQQRKRPRFPKMNVSESERLLSGLMGGVFLLRSAIRPFSGSGVLAAVLGVACLYRALGGHCPAYRVLGINTRERSSFK